MVLVKEFYITCNNFIIGFVLIWFAIVRWKIKVSSKNFTCLVTAMITHMCNVCDMRESQDVMRLYWELHDPVIQKQLHLYISEAEYANQIEKTIIPLKLQNNYKPDGWLGLICGSKLFFDFSGKYKFDDKMKELLKEIENQWKIQPKSTKAIQAIKTKVNGNFIFVFKHF